MTQHFHDLVAHNAWATNQMLSYCGMLDPATLEATAPGTYGSILNTMRHLVAAETSYTFRLTGEWSARPWDDDYDVGMEVLAERVAVLADVQARFLAGEWDSERLGESRGDEGEIFATRASVYLTQLFHHANEHRAQVCTILGALGHEPPDVSAWGYALATGRMWLTSDPRGPTSEG